MEVKMKSVKVKTKYSVKMKIRTTMEADDCSQGCPLIPPTNDSKGNMDPDFIGKMDLGMSFTQAINLIQSQHEALQDLRNQANTYRITNADLQDRIESLTKDIDTLRTNYRDDLSKQKSEVKRLTSLLEVQQECSAQANDELRFQILGIRSKLDPLKHSVSPEVLRASITTSNGTSHHYHSESRERGEQTTGSSERPTSLFVSPRSPISHRAEIVWRIGGFSRKLKKITSGAVDDPFLSDAFSTGPFGYRMSVWAYLNGRGKGQGQCVSLYVRVNAGEFDPILKWPVRPCYTFCLVDQLANPLKRMDHIRIRDLTSKQSGVDRPKKEEKSVIVGFDDFISHDDLSKHNYLTDDSLFIKVIADIHE